MWPKRHEPTAEARVVLDKLKHFTRFNTYTWYAAAIRSSSLMLNQHAFCLEHRRFPPSTRRSPASAFAADILETLSISEASVFGEYDILKSYGFQPIDGVDPLDSGCSSAGRCIGALTRVSSLSLAPPLICSWHIPHFVCRNAPPPFRQPHLRQLDLWHRNAVMIQLNNNTLGCNTHICRCYVLAF